MSDHEAVGSVGELWRFPVKSMGGERVDTCEVTPAGVAGDRAYAVFDVETGKIASAKNRHFAAMLECPASYVEPPTPESTPAALIELGNGTEVRTDDPGANAVLSRFFGREVKLTTSAPERYSIDEYHPDVEGLNPAGDRDVTVDQVLGATFFKALGMEPLVPPGSLMDLFPMSLVTTSALRHFSGLEPGSAWDTRRFRMNLTVDAPGSEMPELGWAGSLLHVGSVTLVAAIPTPRCVMTNLAVEDLPRDSKVLKTIAKHNRLDVAGAGNYPCLGLYALPAQPGRISVGDDVRLEPAELSLAVAGNPSAR